LVKKEREAAIPPTYKEDFGAHVLSKTTY